MTKQSIPIKNGQTATMDDARQILEDEKNKRTHECAAELTAVMQPILMKYRCAWLPMPQFTADGSGGWKISAVDRIIAQD